MPTSSSISTARASAAARDASRCSRTGSVGFCTRPGHTQDLIGICIGHDKQRPESHLLRRDLGLSGRCPGYHRPTVIQTVLPLLPATVATTILSASRCILASARHIRSMIEYKVVLDGVPAFAVEITCSDGAHSLRGFRTEAAALMWIADQEFRAANAEAVATDACIRLRGSEDSALVALYGR